MPKASTTKAVLTADGRVLIAQRDGSFRPANGKTDWQRIRKLSPTEVEQAATDDPHAILTEDDVKDLKQVRLPAKRLISLRLDRDVLDWFKAQGRGYQTRMNAVLRAYMELQQRGSASAASGSRARKRTG